MNSEEFPLSVLRHMPNGFACQKVGCDNDKPTAFIFIEVNAAFEKITGLNRGEVIGRGFSEISSTIGNWELDIVNKTMWTSEEAFRLYGFPYESSFIPLQTA